MTAHSKKGKAVYAVFDPTRLEAVQEAGLWYAQWDKDYDQYQILCRTGTGKISLGAVVLGTGANAPIRHLNGSLLDNRLENLEVYRRPAINDSQELESGAVAIQLVTRTGTLAATALISPQDRERVLTPEYTWVKNTLASGQPVVIANTPQGKVPLRTLIMDCPEDHYIHYINKNPLDHRRENLELKKLDLE